MSESPQAKLSAAIAEQEASILQAESKVQRALDEGRCSEAEAQRSLSTTVARMRARLHFLRSARR